MEDEPNEIERREGAVGVEGPEEELDVELEQTDDVTVVDGDGERNLFREQMARLEEEWEHNEQADDIEISRREEVVVKRDILLERLSELVLVLQRGREEYERQLVEHEGQREMLDPQQASWVCLSGDTVVPENNEEVQDFARAFAQLQARCLEENEAILREYAILQQMVDEISRRREGLLNRRRELSAGFRRLLEEDRRRRGRPILEREQEQQIEVCSEEDIARLPIVQVNQTDVTEETKCTICFEIFVLGETVAEINCHHLFHHECVVPWLLRSTSCPLCRSLVNPSEWPEIPTAEPEHETSLTPNEGTDHTD